MTKDIVMNTGTRTGTLWLTSTELFVVVSECRWMVLFILLVVLADFWYGRSEASKRVQMADITGYPQDCQQAHRLPPLAVCRCGLRNGIAPAYRC